MVCAPVGSLASKAALFMRSHAALARMRRRATRSAPLSARACRHPAAHRLAPQLPRLSRYGQSAFSRRLQSAPPAYPAHHVVAAPLCRAEWGKSAEVRLLQLLSLVLRFGRRWRGLWMVVEVWRWRRPFSSPPAPLRGAAATRAACCCDRLVPFCSPPHQRPPAYHHTVNAASHTASPKLSAIAASWRQPLPAPPPGDTRTTPVSSCSSSPHPSH
jgi:hypothetical protein